jgi:hypothetical protein
LEHLRRGVTQPGRDRAGKIFFNSRYGKLLLLLTLAVRLSRMLMCGLRLGLGIGSMLLGIAVIALGMVLRCGPMRFGSLIMLVGGFLMHVLRHEITPLSGGLKVRMTKASQQASA